MENKKTLEEPKDVVLGYKTSLDAQMLDKVGLEEPKQETLEEAKLRQLFKNRSNCYADTGRFENDGSYSEGEVIQAMDEDCFINVIKEWQAERMYSEEEVVKIVEKSRETGLTAEFLLLTEQFKKK